MELVRSGAGTELGWWSGPEGRRAAGGQLEQATPGLLKSHRTRQAQCLGSQTGVGSKWRVDPKGQETVHGVCSEAMASSFNGAQGSSPPEQLCPLPGFWHLPERGYKGWEV